MNSRHRFGLALTFVLAAAGISLLAAPDLPDQFVTNWDAAGEPSGTMDATLGLWLIPIMAAGLIGLFALLPAIDPLAENIAAFRPTYDWFVVVFTAYLSVLHAGIVAFNLGYEFDFLALVLVGVAALFYYTGVVLTRAKRNWFVGIRTPWTLSNDEVWDRTHALGGTLFKLTAVATVVGLAFGEYAIFFLLVPVTLTAVGTVVYSFVIYRRIKSDDAPDVRA